MSRTLAEMADAERQQMVGRWADWTPAEDHSGLVVIEHYHAEREFAGFVLPGRGYMEVPRHRLDKLTPRFDLPPAWTPDGQPIPGKWDDDNGRNTMRRFVTDWKEA